MKTNLIKSQSSSTNVRHSDFKKEIDYSINRFKKRYGQLSRKLMEYSACDQSKWSSIVKNFRFYIEGFELPVQLRNGDVLAAFGEVVFETLKYSAAEALSSGDHNNLDIDDYIAEFFFDWEPCCENAELFWRVCSFVYLSCGSRDVRWNDAFNRYDRMNISPIRRITLFAGIDCATKNNYPRQFYEKLKTNKKIKVYRVFKVNRNEAVRKSNDRNSKEYLEQNSGKGYSYSLSKITALHLSEAHLNKKIIDKYGENQPTSKNLTGVIMTGKKQTTQDLLSVLGEFEIRKENILGINTTDHYDEEEVITTDSLDLIRYEPVSLVNYLSAHMLHEYKNEIIRNSGPIFWHLQNEKDLLSRAKRFVDRFSKNKELLAEYLTRSEHRFDMLSKEYCKENFTSKKGVIEIKDKITNMSVFNSA